MKKPVLSAKEVLNDISLGLDDAALMEKYCLSAKGLRSLFGKLGKAGMLKQVNARDLVQDLRNGMSDQDIIGKYNLTPKSYSSLIDAAGRAGLFHGIVHRTVASKNIIKASKIAADIRAGMTKAELMKKYQLSPRGLRWISVMLVSSGAMSWKEVFDKLCSSFSELVPDRLRASQRYRVPFKLPIYDSSSPRLIGTVRDVAEKGVGVAGIKALSGENKNLVVSGDEFGELASFSFDATCRWASRDSAGHYFAGFEISGISAGCLGEFQLLIRLVRLLKNQVVKDSKTIQGILT